MRLRQMLSWLGAAANPDADLGRAIPGSTPFACKDFPSWPNFSKAKDLKLSTMTGRFPNDGPMLTVKVGHYVHWRIVNHSHEIHPFHIHQVHFLVYQENGKKAAQPEWLDTINVTPEGSVDLIMDFTDPLIRGMSVFHCHLLKHEDKGMMAKILFQ